ncbi:MAG: 4-(cytidine 5'-diphospho)-2-C-methyl-D-erythritol kinase [Acidobacteriota bacterium]
MTLSCLAPAKINRELRVGGLRPDGFHEIWSRMVSIDLSDRLTVAAAERLDFSCDDPDVPDGDDNLVVRAATLLARHAGLQPRARLRLEKKVPMGRGLGGGSADAAATLLLLTRFWGLAQSSASLHGIASELGSDVPFFLTGGEADVTGRGEVVTPLEDRPPAELVLLLPPFALSTAAVYRAYAGRGTLPERLEIEAGPSSRFLGPNDLASAVLEVEGRMEPYLRAAEAVTPDYAISGSGSTIVLHGVPAQAFAASAARHPEMHIVPCRTLTRQQFQRRIHPTEGAS